MSAPGPRGPSFGCTLFSFTNEWLAGEGPVDVLLEQVAGAGLGPDVEVDGLTYFRGLPVPFEEEAISFRAAYERLGLRPSVYGVYVDRARRRDRWLGLDDSVAELEAQCRAARFLGFDLLRAPFGIELEVIERVLPTLEQLGLVLTLEAQGPMTPAAQPVSSFAAWLDEHSDAPVGLTLDTSVAMPDLPATYRRQLRAAGMSPAVESLLDRWWTAPGPAHERYAAFRADAAEAEAPAHVLERTVSAFVRMGRSRVDDWRLLLPHVRHVHAKFWDWESPDEHVVGPQAEFLRALDACGYQGSVSSEWGGSEWHDRDDADAFELTRLHLEALRSAVGDPVSDPPYVLTRPALGR